MEISIVSVSYNISLIHEEIGNYAEVFYSFKSAFQYASDEIYRLLEKYIETDYRKVIKDEFSQEKGSFLYIVRDSGNRNLIHVSIESKNIKK
ncbi:hypothetical protein P9Z80_24090 [Bacillus cereus]|nr:hypothetical protein [Bacillus cereus]MEC3260692.1 hypothetical protein [Bacillus cereus]